jgi:hypothetical protein
MVDSGIQDKTDLQTFIIHIGDATMKGQDLGSLYGGYHVGWSNEYLKRSYETDQWEKHTWLRATLPTIMSAGNHEGKKVYSDKSYVPSDFRLYDTLMVDPKNRINSKDKVSVKYHGFSYNAAYKVDWGSLRIISLNSYVVMNASEAGNVLSWLSSMIEGRKEGGLPTILLLHPPLWMRLNKDPIEQVGNYWATQEDLEKGVLTDGEYLNSLHDTIKTDVQLVLTGHVHATGRTKVKDGVTYYIIGGGGVPDLDHPGDGDGDLSIVNMATLSNFNCTIMPDNKYCDYPQWYTGPSYQEDGLAWTRIQVDYEAQTIMIKIYNLKTDLIDRNTIPF